MQLSIQLFSKCISRDQCRAAYCVAFILSHSSFILSLIEKIKSRKISVLKENLSFHQIPSLKIVVPNVVAACGAQRTPQQIWRKF